MDNQINSSENIFSANKSFVDYALFFLLLLIMAGILLCFIYITDYWGKLGRLTGAFWLIFIIISILIYKFLVKRKIKRIFIILGLESLALIGFLLVYHFPESLVFWFFLAFAPFLIGSLILEVVQKIFNKFKKTLIIIFSLFLILSIFLLGIETPLTRIVRDIQSSGCKTLANKILQAEKATYPFHRCEKETYKVSNSSKSVSRVYVVAGDVEKKWEFECGFMASCATYVGWFNEDGNLFDFVNPPSVANHDPAVYTLGCGERNTSSIYDIAVKPELAFKNGKYWWEIKYNNTPIKKQNNICNVSGTSIIGYKEVLSNVKADYLFDTDNCYSSKLSPCLTAKALKTNSVEACKYNTGAYDLPTPGNSNLKYDFDCVSNYIVQTGDTTLCGVKANYGKITCDNLVIVKKL